MTKCSVKSDWPPYAINHCLKSYYLKFIDKNSFRPKVLYCSTNMAILFHSEIVHWAVKNDLILKFVQRKNFEDPYFCYGGKHEETVG